jgi:hypothetical protein
MFSISGTDVSASWTENCKPGCKNRDNGSRARTHRVYYGLIRISSKKVAYRLNGLKARKISRRMYQVVSAPGHGLSEALLALLS